MTRLPYTSTHTSSSAAFETCEHCGARVRSSYWGRHVRASHPDQPAGVPRRARLVRELMIAEGKEAPSSAEVARRLIRAGHRVVTRGKGWDLR
jgi:hypothetical protein